MNLHETTESEVPPAHVARVYMCCVGVVCVFVQRVTEQPPTNIHHVQDSTILTRDYIF